MKKDASFRSIRYSGDVLGVDLGSHTVKVIQLRVTSTRAMVLDFAQAEVWQAVAEAKTEADKRAVVTATLRKLLQARKFKASKAAISMPGSHCVVKFLTLPRDYKRDPKTGVPDEAKALSPFEPANTGIEARVVGDGSGSEVEVMALIADKKAVNEAMSVVRKAGLTPSIVLNDALALEGAYAFTRGKDHPEPVAVVDIGAATTTIAILEEGELRAVRTFNIAGDAFTRAIKREFEVETADAEALKKEYGLFGHRMAAAGRAATGKDEAHRIYNDAAIRSAKALGPSAKDLCLAISRTVEVFQERRADGQPSVKTMYLAGGSAEMKGLAEVLQGETNLHVELLRPLEHAFVRQSDNLDKTSAALAVTFGLGISSALRRAAAAAKPRVNLLPVEAKRAAAVRNSMRGVLILAFLVGCVFGARHVMEWQQARVAEQERQIELKLRAEQAKQAAKEGKPAAKPGAPVKKAPEAPNAYLGRASVSGVFGGMVMLNSAKGELTARDGRLFDSMDRPVAGAATSIGGGRVSISIGSEHYSLSLPK